MSHLRAEFCGYGTSPGMVGCYIRVGCATVLGSSLWALSSSHTTL